MLKIQYIYYNGNFSIIKFNSIKSHILLVKINKSVYYFHTNDYIQLALNIYIYI